MSGQMVLIVVVLLAAAATAAWFLAPVQVAGLALAAERVVAVACI